MSKKDFEALADFRYQLRRFLRFSEEITRRHGVTPLQYLLLLNIKGFPGREWATAGELAERLQAKHHGVVALITRCEKLDLVGRRVSSQDRRQVEVRLSKKGEALLSKLAALHRAELLSLKVNFVVPDVIPARADSDSTGFPNRAFSDSYWRTKGGSSWELRSDCGRIFRPKRYAPWLGARRTGRRPEGSSPSRRSTTGPRAAKRRRSAA